MRKNMRKSWVAVTFAAACGLAALGWAQGKPEQYASVKFVVVKERNGKPVRNASVILHEVSKKGKQGKGGLQLKTDSDGKTRFDGLPYGKVRVQVIARGFQTYGEDFEVAQPEMELNIRLKPPQEQITIYEDRKQAPPAESSSGAKKPEERPK